MEVLPNNNVALGKGTVMPNQTNVNAQLYPIAVLIDELRCDD